MKWINKNDRMPDNHSEFEDCSKSVMVSYGKNWGYGHYDYSMERWTYHLVGISEQDDNNITYWAEPPVLPNSIKNIDIGMDKCHIQNINVINLIKERRKYKLEEIWNCDYEDLSDHEKFIIDNETQTLMQFFELAHSR